MKRLIRMVVHWLGGRQCDHCGHFFRVSGSVTIQSAQHALLCPARFKPFGDEDSQMMNSMRQEAETRNREQ